MVAMDRQELIKKRGRGVPFPKGHTPISPFPKGHTPWNKGKRGLQTRTPEQKEEARQRFLKNNPMKSPEIAKRVGRSHAGEKNHNWSGDKVTNSALHRWVRKQIGQPENCYVCSSNKGWMDLANTTGIYKRDLMNWLPLCRKCHAKFDKKKDQYTKEELIAFEDWVISEWKEAKILSPVHLSRGDEKELIRIFRLIGPNDFIFSNYRSHYHALLSGISQNWLKKWIKDNKSIHVMNKDHNFISSAIVGGGVSPAVGTALAMKLKKEKRRVWCFIGDMTATTGIFWECYNYAIREDLPIVFVIADNGLSTDTDTKEVWGMKPEDKHWFEERPLPKIIYYKYTRQLPHYGIGIFVKKIWDDMEDPKSKGF